MFALVRGDVTDGRKDIRTVRGRPLDTVSMVDTPLTGLVIYVKVLQVVVEIDGTGAEVSSEKSGVSGEDGGDVDVSLPAERDREPCQPLVEMCNDRFGPLLGHKLGTGGGGETNLSK